MLSYIQESLADMDIQKENVLEDLEAKELNYAIVGEFLADLKKKFDGGDNKTIKVVKFKKMKQKEKTIEEFIQEFRRVVRESDYKERLLIEEFKRGMNKTIVMNLGLQSQTKEQLLY